MFGQCWHHLISVGWGCCRSLNVMAWLHGRRCMGFGASKVRFTKIILGMGSANERRRFLSTLLIGWAYTQYDPHVHWHTVGVISRTSKMGTFSVEDCCWWCMNLYLDRYIKSGLAIHTQGIFCKQISQSSIGIRAWTNSYIHLTRWPLAPGRSECDSKSVIFNLVLLIGIFRSSYDNRPPLPPPPPPPTMNATGSYWW